jgi:hypothetical protein
MGGLQCAKTVIDQGAGLVRAMNCMSTSILLAAPGGSYPTEEMEEKFVRLADELALLSAEIEHHVREGGGLNEEDGEVRDRGKPPRRGEGL